MITNHETDIARFALDAALKAGAAKARVSLCKNKMDLVSTLNGKLDKCTSCLDRSIDITLFVDGRYGKFSTNKLECSSLQAFIENAIDTVRMLAPDPCRDLPSQERIQKDAISGNELSLVDSHYPEVQPEDRKAIALNACITGRKGHELLVSEEAEFSDGIYDTIIIDSQGTFCRHTETSFEYFVEVTVKDEDESLYSAYWWDESPRLENLNWKDCAETAYLKAISSFKPKKCRSRRCNMVVDSEVASKFVSPILRALNGNSIQQHNSFLDGKLGLKVFSEGLDLFDEPCAVGKSNSCMFDDEGVATKAHSIIEKGVVKEYFLNTYTAAKLGMQPSCQGAVRPRIKGWPVAGLRRDDILKICSDGILVTDFNGGNSNAATGDFSFGIEGFEFKNGKILRPVREMIVTGNLTSLWNNLTACGEDARECMSKLIPTLAFSNVDFRG